MEKETLARPYAKAVFSVARAGHSFDKWQSFLIAGATVLRNKKMVSFIDSPKETRETVLRAFQNLLGDLFFEEASSLLVLLFENQKLAILPEIENLFRLYRESFEKTMVVHVKTTVPLAENEKAALIKKLEHRLSREVVLACELDPDILGGMIIYADDLVIDRSVRGQLSRLEQVLTN
jgi:F-type H+-transporting ATPase subunit delta